MKQNLANLEQNVNKILYFKELTLKKFPVFINFNIFEN